MIKIMATNRSDLVSALSAEFESEDYVERLENLNDHIDLIEAEIKSIIEELEGLPETFDVKGNYVELDDVIARLSKISDMIY